MTHGNSLAHIAWLDRPTGPNPARPPMPTTSITTPTSTKAAAKKSMS